MRLNDNSIKLSQTTIKGLGLRLVNAQIEDHDEHCPAKFKYKVVDGNFPASDLMQRGIVLESRLIGGSRNETALDLPLNKNGKPSIHQSRIEEHELWYKNVWIKKNEAVINEYNVQMPIVLEFPYKVEGNQIVLTGVTDIFPLPMNGETAIIDIKYYSGHIAKADFWMRGNPMLYDCAYLDSEHFNTLQGSLYTYIIKRMKLEWLKRYWASQNTPHFSDIIDQEMLNKIQRNNIAFYWHIFSTAKFENSEEEQFMRRHQPQIGEEKILEELIRRAAERFLSWEKEGWREKYSDLDCKNCALKERCNTYKNRM